MLKKFFYYISRIIYYITPLEFKIRERDLNPLTKYIDNENAKNSFNYFKDIFKQSVLFNSRHEIREYAIKEACSVDKNHEFFYLEFGIFKGTSANFFSKYVKKLFAFDSFEGLREDWVGHNLPKSHFNLDKKIPKLNSNIEPVVGFVQDTLEDFLVKHNPSINFVHLDMKTYSSTKFTLEKIKPYLRKNAIVIFNQLYNYYGWEQGEFKALNEVFNKDEYSYLAFNSRNEQAVIKINI